MPFFQNTIEKIFGFSDIKAHYQKIVSTHPQGVVEFLDHTLKSFEITVACSEESVSRIPEKGPLIVVANHPFGGVEGIVLAHMLLKRRADLKIFANPILKTIEELQEIFLFVDPYDTKEAFAANISQTKKAFMFLKNGGVLGLFPSGEVSHVTWNNWTVTDPKWNDSFVHLAWKTKAQILPVFFEGKNGPLFQALGLIHPMLRTLRLPKEIMNKQGQTLKMRIGHPFSIFTHKDKRSASKVSQYVRTRTYFLKERPLQAHLPVATPSLQPIAHACSSEMLHEEVMQLPQENTLVEYKEFWVKFARAKEIPLLMHEIARQREVTFRQVQEGTGKPLDTDAFDDHYVHLFVWNKDEKDLLGAYRLGLVDEILPLYGKKGLYTYGLFFYEEDFIKILGSSIEMGRSFIVEKYQRNFASLFLLWKGIGAFVGRNPRYKKLFGPVSISGAYSDVSKELMVAYLMDRHYDEKKSKWMHPKHPFVNQSKNIQRLLDKQGEFFLSMDELGAWIKDQETGFEGVPILIKHYVKLGAKFLAFNVDPDFNHSLDGLIEVDLTESDPKMMKNYMGEDLYAQYMKERREKIRD